MGIRHILHEAAAKEAPSVFAIIGMSLVLGWLLRRARVPVLAAVSPNLFEVYRVYARCERFVEGTPQTSHERRNSLQRRDLCKIHKGEKIP